MIDVHFHCLPGIDDGPATWDQAVALCRAAAEQGTSTIVATPHVLREQWLNEDPSARDELVLKLNTLLEGRPAILPGCEYFLSSDAVEQVERGRWGPLTTLNRGRYLLLEFPPGPVTSEAEAIFFELSLLSITPVLAHPERHAELARTRKRLEDFVARGALIQVTAGSLLGDFGEGARQVSRDLLDRRLVHLVGSDAHSLDRRPPRLADAREAVWREWGHEVATGLFDDNPSALLRSDPLPWDGRAPNENRGTP